MQSRRTLRSVCNKTLLADVNPWLCSPHIMGLKTATPASAGAESSSEVRELPDEIVDGLPDPPPDVPGPAQQLKAGPYLYKVYSAETSQALPGMGQLRAAVHYADALSWGVTGSIMTALNLAVVGGGQGLWAAVAFCFSAAALRLRSTRIREIHLGCRVMERKLPAGWQPRAVFEIVELTARNWRGVDKPVGPLALQTGAVIHGYDTSLLAWADRAAASPQKALGWITSKGDQRDMPAWGSLPLQHRYLLALLAAKPLEDLPFATVQDNLHQQAQDKVAAAQLQEHAASNSGRAGPSLCSLMAKQLRTASDVLLWQAECLGIILWEHKHRTSGEPKH